MKQKLRLWVPYCLKRIQLINLAMGRLYSPDPVQKSNRHSFFRRWIRTCVKVADRYIDNTTAVSDTASGLLRDRSKTAAVVLGMYELSPRVPRAVLQQRNSKVMARVQHEDSTMMRSLSGVNKPRGKMHTETLRPADGGHGKAYPIPSSSPPSFTLPLGPIPICPAYISVKSPKSGTLAKGKRLHSGRKAHSNRERVAQEPGWDHVGDRFGSASEVSLLSMLPYTALRLAAPNGVQFKSKPSPIEVQTKHRSHSEGYPVRRWGTKRPLTARDWFEYGKASVRQLLAIASAFSRSVAEGLSKPSRTLVEALSKDCRTSLEQQSNNCRRNIEESCVCTHAMAPAPSGLGLALGLVVLLVQMPWFLEARGQGEDDTDTTVIEHHEYGLPTVIAKRLNDSAEMARIPQFVPHADLNRFPLVKYKVEVDGAFRGLNIGDTIPDYLWNLPLWVVNHPKGIDTLTLGEYRNRRLLVLDFWASWCSPCVKSMDKWEGFVNELDEIALVGVHMGFDYNALPLAQKRGWKSVSVIGGNAYLLNRYFFNRSVVSRLVWIKGGKLAAITNGRGYDLETVRKFADGENVDIPLDFNWTYSATNKSIADLN